MEDYLLENLSRLRDEIFTCWGSTNEGLHYVQQSQRESVLIWIHLLLWRPNILQESAQGLQGRERVLRMMS